MKIKQTNTEGVEEEIDVMTQEEVDAKLAAEKAVLEESHKNSLAEKETAFQALATEKSTLEAKIKQAEIDGMKEDHPNFKILKEALNKKDEDIKAIKSELDNDKKQRVNEEMESKIKIASKGNVELEKKIQYHLEKTLSGLKSDTKEERQVKLEAAFKLASDGSSAGPGIFDGGIDGSRGGSGGSSDGAPSGVEFSAREKALGAKLGISAEDYKKYANRVSKKI